MVLSIASTILSIGVLVVASLVAIYVGKRRGIDQVEDQADSEVARLVNAQSQRLAVLEAENRRLTGEVSLLQTTVAQLRVDLDIEKRITSRLRDAAT